MPAAPPLHNDNPADLKAVDLLFDTMMALNMIDPDNKHGGDTRYATQSEGMPYWHIVQALHQAAAHLLRGNQRRADALVNAMISDGGPVETVLPRLREEWAAADPIDDILNLMILRTEMRSEADVIQWAAVRAGLRWVCGDGNCRYHNADSVDECQSCGEPRPVPA